MVLTEEWELTGLVGSDDQPLRADGDEELNQADHEVDDRCDSQEGQNSIFLRIPHSCHSEVSDHPQCLRDGLGDECQSGDDCVEAPPDDGIIQVAHGLILEIAKGLWRVVVAQVSRTATIAARVDGERVEVAPVRGQCASAQDGAFGDQGAGEHGGVIEDVGSLSEVGDLVAHVRAGLRGRPRSSRITAEEDFRPEDGVVPDGNAVVLDGVEVVHLDAFADFRAHKAVDDGQELRVDPHLADASEVVGLHGASMQPVLELRPMVPFHVAGLELTDDAPLLEDRPSEERQPKWVHVDPGDEDAEPSEGLIVEVVAAKGPEPLEDEHGGDVGDGVREHDERHSEDGSKKVLLTLELPVNERGGLLVGNAAHGSVPAGHGGQREHSSVWGNLRLLGQDRAWANGGPVSQLDSVQVQVPVHDCGSADSNSLADSDVIAANQQVRLGDV
mmetsp:Transcript_56690/g.120601  ORF Transcript_56690/g.120601 Transcript_56690/m.120601 type:complete len:444 (+) Transcript_56690:552-1883(+)